MHRRGLLLVFALQILVRDRRNPGEIGDLSPDMLLDTEQLGQLHATLGLVRILHHERRLPVGTVRNQWIVGVQLVLDACRLENPFDTQHFLDLVLHGQRIFEVQRGVRTDRQLAVLLVRHDTRTEIGPHLGVLFQTEQIVASEFAHHVVLVLSVAAFRCHRPDAARKSGVPGRYRHRGRWRSDDRPSHSHCCSDPAHSV